MTGQRIGYARVSTNEQHPEAQADKLKAAGCERIFTDEGVSGRLARRAQWDACLGYLRPGDVLVITKLDRAGRSVKHLVELAEQLKQRRIDLQVLDQGIDTTTPVGRMLFHVLAAIAEFEADLVRERTMDGLAAARARGRKGGRKPKLTGKQGAMAREMYESRRHAMKDIAETFGVSQMTIYRHLHREQEPVASQPNSGVR